MTLSNFHLQIVTKYFKNYEDYNNILKLNSSIKKFYNSTFDYLKIPFNYILTYKEVKYLKELVQQNFNYSQLNQIELNFNCNITYVSNLYIIIKNYEKFKKIFGDKKIIINFNKSKNIKIVCDDNLKFNKLEFLKYFDNIMCDCIKDYNIYLLMYDLNRIGEYNFKNIKYLFDYDFIKDKTINISKDIYLNFNDKIVKPQSNTNFNDIDFKDMRIYNISPLSFYHEIENFPIYYKYFKIIHHEIIDNNLTNIINNGGINNSNFISQFRDTLANDENYKKFLKLIEINEITTRISEFNAYYIKLINGHQPSIPDYNLIMEILRDKFEFNNKYNMEYI